MGPTGATAAPRDMLGIDRLRESDLPAALRLSTQSGWNQVEADWRRLLDLWPDTCLAGRVSGDLVATATLATYAAREVLLGWFGMVLVDEAHRRRGYGGRILDEIVDAGLAREVCAFGLDATELGRPVYLGRGFRDAVGIDRWERPCPASGVAPQPVPQVVIPSPDMLESLAALDDAAAGVGRRDLIHHLIREPGVRMRVVADGGRVTGYGVARPGRVADHIGPVVARSEPEAGTIVAALLADSATSGTRRVLIDVPSGKLAGTLPSLGFVIARRLVRMVRPAAAGDPPLTGPHVYAAAGFELG